MAETPAPDAADRRARVLVIVSALLLLLEGALVLASAAPWLRDERIPGAAPGATPGSAGSPYGHASADTRGGLELDKLRRLTPEEAYAAGLAWARRAASDGRVTERELAAVLPAPAFFLARTSSDDYVDDIRDSAAGGSAFAKAYRRIDEAMPGSNAAGVRVEAALAAVHSVRLALNPVAGSAGRPGEPSRGGSSARALHPPVPRGQGWIGSRDELRKTHQHALDLFFLGEGERGSAEKGPVIRSMSAGVVVAAADDWVGGEGAAKYRRGGLTPRAGNGAVIYDPEAGRYYTYFHLHDVSVRPGQWVLPGDPLGRGGNTGTNARKRGHGGHLHLEIYDAPSDRALDCYELRDLVLSL